MHLKTHFFCIIAKFTLTFAQTRQSPPNTWQEDIILTTAILAMSPIPAWGPGVQFSLETFFYCFFFLFPFIFPSAIPFFSSPLFPFFSLPPFHFSSLFLFSTSSFFFLLSFHSFCLSKCSSFPFLISPLFSLSM